MAGAIPRLAGSVRRQSAADRSAAIEAIVGIAAEVRSGAPLGLGLKRVAASLERPILGHANVAAGFGGDIPAALRADAAEHRLASLRALAAVWQVAERSGAGMAEAADRLAKAEAANEGIRRELASQLAGPKASARILAVLPLVGLLMGSGLGGSPLSWLVGTLPGNAVLVAGIALEALGLWWVSRLIRSVERLL